MKETKYAKATTSLDGLLTAGQIYTVLYETLDPAKRVHFTVVDDRGIQCMYSESRFELVLAPQVAPNFSQMQQIADEVNITLQPDESGIKCPVVEQEKLRKATARIAELEDQLEISMKSYLSHVDDCYYWTPAGWEEFKNLRAENESLKAELAVLKRGAL